MAGRRSVQLLCACAALLAALANAQSAPCGLLDPSAGVVRNNLIQFLPLAAGGSALASLSLEEDMFKITVEFLDGFEPVKGSTYFQYYFFEDAIASAKWISTGRASSCDQAHDGLPFSVKWERPAAINTLPNGSTVSFANNTITILQPIVSPKLPFWTDLDGLCALNATGNSRMGMRIYEKSANITENGTFPSCAGILAAGPQYNIPFAFACECTPLEAPAQPPGSQGGGESPPPARALRPPPAQAGCTVSADTCANTYSDGTCDAAAPSTCNIAAQLLNSQNGLSAASGALQTFLSIVNFRDSLAKTLATAGGGQCAVTLPLFNGSTIVGMANGVIGAPALITNLGFGVNAACGLLPLPDGGLFYLLNLNPVPQYQGCIALDPCTQTYAAAFTGAEITFTVCPLPPVTVTIGLDAFGVSLSGALQTTSSASLFAISPTGLVSFAPVTVYGNVYLAAHASVGIGLPQCTIGIGGSITLMINYDPNGNGANSPEHDHEFMVEMATNGPTLKFASMTIDLSFISASVTVHWQYLNPNSWKMQTQVQVGASLSDMFKTVPKIGNALAFLLPDLNLNVLAALYVDQIHWGVAIGVSASVTFKSPSQLGSKFTGQIPVPATTQSAGAYFVLTGMNDGTGVRIQFYTSINSINLTPVFDVNFCSSDNDCIDKNQVCVGLGALSACAVLDSCTKASYGRGAGVVPSVCPNPNTQTKQGAFCYPNCASGYSMFVASCFEICPSYLTDTGCCCQDSVYIYGKGCCCTIFGCCGCPSGFTDDGCTCRRDRSHAKASYTQSAIGLVCPPGMENQAGLCYTPCAAGYYGVGPVCWQSCTTVANYAPYDGGTYCTSRSDGVITVTAAHACSPRPRP